MQYSPQNMFLFFSHCFLSVDCLFRLLESYTKSCNRDSHWLLNWYLQLENLCLNASKVMDPLCKLKFITIRDIGFIKSISTLSSCLQDQVLIFQTISDFLVLTMSMSPCLVLHVMMLVWQWGIYQPHRTITVVCQETSMRPISALDLLGVRWQMTPQLSGEIRYSTVIPCDCHGLLVGINLDPTELLENA